MKKICLCTMFLIMLLMCMSFQVVADTVEAELYSSGLEAEIQAISESVKTPNGTYVTYFVRVPDGVTDVGDIDGVMLASFDVRKHLGMATRRYNCHSYAWHDQNIDRNIFWIDWPDIYITCTMCSYSVDDSHSWDDAYDEEGDHYNYCMQCGYITYYMPLSAEAFAVLPEATQRALIAAIKEQTGDFIMYLDAEQGVLCYEGALYLFDVPNDSVLTSYLQPIALDEDLLQILHPILEIE